MPKALELRQQRAGAVSKARGIVDKAKAENREMTADENAEFDRWMGDEQRFRLDAEAAERSERLEASEAELRASTGRRTEGGRPAGGDGASEMGEHEYRESIRAWALADTDKGRNDADTLHLAARCGVHLPSKTISLRALSKGTASAGGNTVPTGMVPEIIKALKFFNPIRGMVKSLPTDSGTDLDYPKVSDTGNTAGIIGEGGTFNTNADPTFSKVAMKAWKYGTTIVLVSVELLQDSAVDVVSLLAGLLGERMGRGQGTHFVTGNGTTQPEGLATGATVGVNLASGNVLTFDKVIDLIYSVDRAYRMNGSFLTHDETMAGLVKLKDSTGQYLWQPGLQVGDPDRIKNYPVGISNDLTSITSPGDNAPLMLFGDMAGGYLIRDVRGSMQMTRLNELYAATGQVGFMLMMRSDGRYIKHAGCVKSLNSYDAP